MAENNEKLDLQPAIIVIFGITGDLSQRKLLPSLYHLLKNNLLHKKTRILGVTRQEIPHEKLLEKATANIHADNSYDENVLKKLLHMIEAYHMDASKADGYPGLREELDRIEDEVGMCLSRIYYLSIPPKVSMPIIRRMGEHSLNHGCRRHDAKARLLMEKPFGFNLKTAGDLIEGTTHNFNESQIFRIDHYLAKETVQNIVTFRFRNPIFEDLWDKQHVQSIEIAADEKLGIESRANFYEQTGALRDLIQSHLLHVMSVVMMDKPQDLNSSDEMHAARLQLLESIEPISKDKLEQCAVRGQYKNYRKEVGNPASNVETFAALKLFSRQERWQNVPIFVRTGKALRAKQTKVTMTFCPAKSEYGYTNQLIFYIQPNESIVVRLRVKQPGFDDKMQTAEMRFDYQQTFDEAGHPDAYERVLVDALRGDHTLFATSEEIVAAWRIIEPAIEDWGQSGDNLKFYEAGSDGPDTSVLTSVT